MPADGTLAAITPAEISASSPRQRQLAKDALGRSKSKCIGNQRRRSPTTPRPRRRSTAIGVPRLYFKPAEGARGELFSTSAVRGWGHRAVLYQATTTVRVPPWQQDSLGLLAKACTNFPFPRGRYRYNCATCAHFAHVSLIFGGWYKTPLYQASHGTRGLDSVDLLLSGLGQLPAVASLGDKTAGRERLFGAHHPRMVGVTRPC